MYLSLILKRLRSNYYTNKLSVLADIELIEQNCYKYNENNNDMHDLACEMYDKFQSLMNAIEEPMVDDRESSDDESDNEAANQPSSRAQRAARASRSRTARTDSIGRGNNEESVDHQEVAPRRTRRAAASQRTSQPESPPESPSQRTSSRARSVRSKPAYTEKDSDEDEEESSSDEDEIEEEEESSGGEASEDDQAEDNRRGGRLPPRGRSRRSKPSYADVGSSGAEESSEEDEVSSEEEVVDTKKRKRGGGGRRSTSTAAAAVEPRKKRGRTVNYPELPRWEHVTRRQIHRVGTAILVELVSPTFSIGHIICSFLSPLSPADSYTLASYTERIRYVWLLHNTSS